MALNETQTFAIVGILLGLAFIGGLFAPMVVSGYVPQLKDWQYMRPVAVTLQSSVDYYAILKFPLPSDEQFASHSSCNDVRFTIGSGKDERLLTSWVDDNCTYAFVFTYPESTELTLRLYYGNPDASAQEPLFTSPNVYSAPPFDEQDYYVRYCDDGWHGNMTFYTSYVYLARWDDDCASLTLGHELQRGQHVEAKLWARGWGDAEIYALFTESNVDPSYNPSTAVKIESSHGRVRISLIVDGAVVNSTYRSRYRDFYLRFYDAGDVYRVYVDNIYLGDLPASGSYFTFITDEGKSEVRLKALRVFYDVVDAAATYGDEVPAPKAPNISITPSDGSVVRSPVELSVTVDDPNNDLVRLMVYLDNNLLYDGNDYSYSTELNLSDGLYTVSVYAVDSEQIEVNVMSTFVVDTEAPVLDVTYEQNDGVLFFEINASDPNLSHCYYTYDNNTVDILCQSTLELNYSEGTYTFCVVDLADNSTCVDVQIIAQPSSASASATSSLSPATSTTVYVSKPYVTEVAVPVSTADTGQLSVLPSRYIILLGLVFFLFVVAWFFLR